MNYIIDFEPHVSAVQISQYMTDNNLTVLSVYDHFEHVYVVTGAIPPKTDAVASVVIDDTHAIKLLDVVPITDDAPEITFDHDDQNWWKVVSLIQTDLDAPTTTMKRKGHSVNVYLVDSGITALHPEFADSDITNLFSVNGTFDDLTGHGTALASLITGKTCSIADPALKVVKIFDNSGNVKQSQLLAAMDAIIADVVANPTKLAIANMSWAIPRNEYLDAKIQLMIDRGIVVVAAAGNSGLSIDDVTPAAIDQVITIGAYDQSFHPCDFSSYTGTSDLNYTEGATNNGALDGWAPGEKIYVANVSGGYSYAVGTSLSAAIHTAICAYNGMQMLDADGAVLTCIESIVTDTKAMSLSRKDLMVYPDSKYNDSVNKVSTCFNVFTASQRVPKLVENIAFTVGIPNCRRLFHPLMTASYEVLGEIPEGLTLYRGMLYGSPTTDQVDYELKTFEVDVTTMDGHTINQLVNILIKQPEYDPTLLPANDPVLSVMYMTCSGFTCGSCGGSNSCGCGNTKAGGCECLCLGCDCP
jgi:hypothetical protein